MPRNRQDIPHEIRRGELIRIARQVFLEVGYADATLAEIARRAGVAPNAVRWYFKHKDDALAAVVDALLDSAFGTVAGGGTDPDAAAVDRHPRPADAAGSRRGAGTGGPSVAGWSEALADLLTAVGRLSAYRALAPAVNERAPYSAAVDACRERTHRLLAERVEAVVVARRLTGSSAQRARDALLLVLDGELTNTLAWRHSADLLHFVATSLLDQAPRYRMPARVPRPGRAGVNAGPAALDG